MEESNNNEASVVIDDETLEQDTRDAYIYLTGANSDMWLNVFVFVSVDDGSIVPVEDMRCISYDDGYIVAHPDNFEAIYVQAIRRYRFDEKILDEATCISVVPASKIVESLSTLSSTVTSVVNNIWYTLRPLCDHIAAGTYTMSNMRKGD